MLRTNQQVALHVGAISCPREKNKGAAHLNQMRHDTPVAWLWRIRGAYTSAWFNSCNALHVYAVKSRMRVQTQCGQGRNEASEIKYVSFRLTTEEYTQIENRACLSAATPFDCVSRRILNDPKMRLGSRILEQKYLRVAGSSTPISRLLIMKSELGSSKNRYSNGCRARQPSAIEAQVLNVCQKQPTQRMWRWE